MRKHYRCPLLVSCLLAMLLVLGIWKVYQNILRWMEKKTLETCSNCITLLSLFQSSINLKFLKLVFEEDTNISVISQHRKIPMTTREVLLSARQQGWVWSLLYLNPSFLAHHLSQSAEFFFFFLIEVLSTHSASFLLQKALGEKHLTSPIFFPHPTIFLMPDSTFLEQGDSGHYM